MISIYWLFPAFLIGMKLENWRNRPPRGYDAIVMPKDTHLIFEDSRVRVVRYGEEWP